MPKGSWEGAALTASINRSYERPRSPDHHFAKAAGIRPRLCARVRRDSEGNGSICPAADAPPPPLPAQQPEIPLSSLLRALLCVASLRSDVIMYTAVYGMHDSLARSEIGFAGCLTPICRPPLLWETGATLPRLDSVGRARTLSCLTAKKPPFFFFFEYKYPLADLQMVRTSGLTEDFSCACTSIYRAPHLQQPVAHFATYKETWRQFQTSFPKFDHARRCNVPSLFVYFLFFIFFPIFFVVLSHSILTICRAAGFQSQSISRGR